MCCGRRGKCAAAASPPPSLQHRVCGSSRTQQQRQPAAAAPACRPRMRRRPAARCMCHGVIALRLRSCRRGRRRRRHVTRIACPPCVLRADAVGAVRVRDAVGSAHLLPRHDAAAAGARGAGTLPLQLHALPGGRGGAVVHALGAAEPGLRHGHAAHAQVRGWVGDRWGGWGRGRGLGWRPCPLRDGTGSAARAAYRALAGGGQAGGAG